MGSPLSSAARMLPLPTHARLPMWPPYHHLSHVIREVLKPQLPRPQNLATDQFSCKKADERLHTQCLSKPLPPSVLHWSRVPGGSPQSVCVQPENQHKGPASRSTHPTLTFLWPRAKRAHGTLKATLQSQTPPALSEPWRPRIQWCRGRLTAGPALQVTYALDGGRCTAHRTVCWQCNVSHYFLLPPVPGQAQEPSSTSNGAWAHPGMKMQPRLTASEADAGVPLLFLSRSPSDLVGVTALSAQGDHEPPLPLAAHPRQAGGLPHTSHRLEESPPLLTRLPRPNHSQPLQGNPSPTNGLERNEAYRQSPQWGRTHHIGVAILTVSVHHFP